MSEYTYLIKSDYFPDDFIDNLFKKRGNWHKVTDSELKKYPVIDFIYLDGMNYLKPQYYSLKSNLKNIVNDDKRSIGFKNELMKNLQKIPKAEKFLMPQYEIDLFKIKKNHNQLESIRHFFKKDKVYIFKPVTGMGGSGIKVFDNFNDCKTYIFKNITDYGKLWNDHSNIDKQKNRMWVIQEYITNPLLIIKNGMKYKFHIRHFYLYQPGNKPSFYKKIGKMALAEKPYIHGNWLDSKIHDTHFHDFDKYLFNIDDTDISKSNMNNINKMINQFYKILDKIINAKCYSESKNCYELFGVDFMITDDYKLKILEVNFGLGLSSNLTQNKKELFEGIIDLIVDDYFPPLNKIKHNSNKLFVKI